MGANGPRWSLTAMCAAAVTSLTRHWRLAAAAVQPAHPQIALPHPAPETSHLQLHFCRPLAWEDVMLGLLLEDVADPQDHFSERLLLVVSGCRR